MPIDKEKLKKRDWPLPIHPVGHEVIGRKKRENEEEPYYDDFGLRAIAKEGGNYSKIPFPEDYCESCYVQEEKVKAISLPFPPEETEITSLTKDKKGKIYGVTSGERAHLFVYDPDKGKSKVEEIGIIAENCEKSSIAISKDNQLFLATKPKSKEGYIYSFNPEDVASGIKKVICPVKGEGISTLAIDDSLSCIYGLSSKTGTFFIFYPDKNKVKLKGKVDKDNLFSEVLAVTAKGDVFGVARWGRFFKYNPTKGKIVFLKIKAPSLKGKEMYNSVDCLLVDEDSQIVYGGTSCDGILFKFYPEEERIISLGKPLNQPHIRCLTLGKDGILYGIAGKSCCHLFRYNPTDGELLDIGILFVKSPRHWFGYEFSAAVTGEKGEIYIGEYDRISHLFIYYPGRK